MPKESDETRRDRKAKEARDRRRKRGLCDRGGAGKRQGRKIADLDDRPICCDRPMWSHGARYWRCKVCKISQRKKTEENDD